MSGIWCGTRSLRCSDFGEILTGALNDHTWQNLCRAVDRPDLGADPELATNAGRVAQRTRVVDEFRKTFAVGSAAEWSERLERHGVPVAPLHTIAQSLDHPQTRANGMVVEMERQEGQKMQLLGSSFKLDHGPRHADLPPPRLGEHTDEILAQHAGLDPASIATLREQGVV